MRVRAIQNSSSADYSAVFAAVARDAAVPVARAEAVPSMSEFPTPEPDAGTSEAGSRFVSGDALADYRRITAAPSASSGASSFKSRFFA